MAPSISDYAEAKLLDAVFNSAPFCVTGDPYVSLHTGAPSEAAGSDGTEIVGGSYARKQVSWVNATSGAGTLDNSKHAFFTNMPACTLTHVGIWDAASAGNQLWSGALTTSKVVNSGDSFELGTGDIDVTLA